MFSRWSCFKSRAQGVQNQQGAIENFKNPNVVKRRIGMVNGHRVTFISGEEPEEGPAKRSNTADGTGPADPMEVGAS